MYDLTIYSCQVLIKYILALHQHVTRRLWTTYQHAPQLHTMPCCTCSAAELFISMRPLGLHANIRLPSTFSCSKTLPQPGAIAIQAAYCTVQWYAARHCPQKGATRCQHATHCSLTPNVYAYGTRLASWKLSHVRGSPSSNSGHSPRAANLSQPAGVRRNLLRALAPPPAPT